MSVWQAVEEGWLDKTVDYLNAQYGAAELERSFKRFTPNEANSPLHVKHLAVLMAIYDLLVVRKDAAGKTVADRWGAEDWKGLNNDERQMMIHRSRSTVVVLEVQRALSPQLLECVDLLDPEAKRFSLMGTEQASRIPRFTKLLGWLTRYPNFNRTNAAGTDIPDFVWPVWRKIARDQTRELQKTRPEMTESSYLAENLASMIGLITALAQDFRRRLVETLDVYQCTAQFRLTGSLPEVKAFFDGKVDFAPEAVESSSASATLQSVYTWKREGESEKFNHRLPPNLQLSANLPASNTLGVVLLYSDRLVVETTSILKHRFSREYLGQHLGQLVRFERESIVDLNKENARKAQVWTSDPQEAPVGPGPNPQQDIESKRRSAWEAHRKHFNQLIERPNPQLDNLTPRVAAQNPEIRPRLVEWLKGQVHHLEVINQHENLDLNIDWILDELAAPELKAN